jgi:hypothetical protein
MTNEPRPFTPASRRLFTLILASLVITPGTRNKWLAVLRWFINPPVRRATVAQAKARTRSILDDVRAERPELDDELASLLVLAEVWRDNA